MSRLLLALTMASVLIGCSQQANVAATPPGITPWPFCFGEAEQDDECDETNTITVTRDGLFSRQLKADPEWICISMAANPNITIVLPPSPGKAATRRSTNTLPAWLNGDNNTTQTRILLTATSTGDELKFDLFENGRCTLDPRVTVRN